MYSKFPNVIQEISVNTLAQNQFPMSREFAAKIYMIASDSLKTQGRK